MVMVVIACIVFVFFLSDLETKEGIFEYPLAGKHALLGGKIT